MVSSSSSSTLSLYLILFLSFLSLFSPSQSHKVSVELYYESLCPYSARFIVNKLPKLFKDDLLSFVDLKLSPWGNARLTSNSTFDCQHGPYECLLNTVEACAIDIWPQPTKYFPFIFCVEDLVSQRKHREWESCFAKLGLDSTPINQCYKGDYGKKLELKYGAETEALKPPHQYVPWVVVNGVPLYDDYEDFLIHICNAYQGTVTPESCIEISYLSTIRDVGAKVKHSVCDNESVKPMWEKIRSTITSWIYKMNLVGEI